jgi:hypothetical protein
MSADPICETVNPEAATEEVMVTEGKLANVFVYARTGNTLDTFQFEVPTTAVVLEHQGCHFVPHVIGVQAQQSLSIVNGDPTTHNTHAMPRNNPEWMQSQPQGAPAFERKFLRPEPLIPIKDNQHPWEKAYLGVFSHPFFAVSNVDGAYKIAGLPPGQYTIVAWHEKYGEQTFDVTVGSKERKTLDFTFTSPNN